MTKNVNTATDVVTALEGALSLAEGWLETGEGTTADKLRVYSLIREFQKRGGRLSEVAAETESVLISELSEPQEVDGQWWRTKRKATRRGWDKLSLKEAINKRAFAERPTVDLSTGEIVGTREPTTVEVLDTVWAAVDVATGRTKVLREQFELDLDEYAQTDWTSVVEACELSDIKPDTGD
jgi:hypothetical protein